MPSDRRHRRGIGERLPEAGGVIVVGVLDPPQPGLVELSSEQLESAASCRGDLFV